MWPEKFFMRLYAAIILCFALVSTSAIDRAHAEDDPGAKQFKKSCGTCHIASLEDQKRQGPNLWKVLGRPAGVIDGFKYSDNLRASGLTWDEATLDAWLTNPKKLVPGTIMSYRQRNPDKRKLVIDYLASMGRYGED